MRKLLETTAQLEFDLVKCNQSIVRAFFKIDKLIAQRNKARANAKNGTSDASSSATLDSATQLVSTISEESSTGTDSAKAAKKAKADTSNPYAGLSKEEAAARYEADHPFTTLFQTYFVPSENSEWQPVNYMADQFPEGEYNFMIVDKTLKKFWEMLSRPEVAALIPGDLKIIREAKPIERIKKQSNTKAYYFFALKKDPELKGNVITDARATFDPSSNKPMVLMYMDADGSDRWARITGANLKKRVAVVLDDQVYTAPTVQSKISGGSSQITGMADIEEAKLLQIVLKAGALKAPVEIIEERVVGPSLGEDSIKSGLFASGIAFLLVVLFMLFYYVKGGLVANFSVLLNILIVISVLAGFGGTLTLPGIAGIILTIGMAVDTNILIYERIREELRHGRSLRSAVDEGFHKAFSAIIDTHITTLITGIILYMFGSGAIQGFALTLIIGITSTLFTQIVVSRAMINLIISRGSTHFNFGQPQIITQ